MSFLFIYSLINYYTALSSLTLQSSLGGGSSGSAARAASQGSGAYPNTHAGLVAPPARMVSREEPVCNYQALEQTAAPGLQQTPVETLTGYSTSALARLVSPLKDSFPAQHPVLAIRSAFPNADGPRLISYQTSREGN